jgi:hypothetical protein
MKTLQEISDEITSTQNKIRNYKYLQSAGAIGTHFANRKLKDLELKVEILQAGFDNMYNYNNNEKI